MAVPIPPDAKRSMRVLRFIDVLEDMDPTKLSWTKIGVAWSTVLTVITGTTAAIQTALDSAAHTNWSILAAAVGLHGITKTAHEVKRYTEKSNG